MSKSKFKDNICPICLSKLISNNNILTCTGSKLKIWEKDFNKYEKMNENEKKNFLISFSDSERFLELYNKWSYVDKNNERSNFTCGYTNKIFNLIPETRIYMPDPLQVKNLEQALHRSLTEEELAGESDIVVDGSKIELKQMVFPDDF